MQFEHNDLRGTKRPQGNVSESDNGERKTGFQNSVGMETDYTDIVVDASK